ncbi:MAG TPA: vanadium-dependent haloperoxidase [Gemmatirosa sp.]|nr:vanadium-dependent haloperoxidase [Gemmatirosa sp.]
MRLPLPISLARVALVAALGTTAGACGRAGGDAAGGPRPSDAEMLQTAMRHLTSVIVYDIFSPPQAARAYTYASVAAYEVLRQGSDAHRSLAGQLNGLAPVPLPVARDSVDLPLAGVHAFMTVGRQLTFSRERMDSLRTALDDRYRLAGLPAPVYERSIAYGDTVAQHVLAWAAKDRFLQTRGMPKFSVTGEPGRWIPTPPAYMDAVEPNWGALRPFALDSAGQYGAEPPYAFDTTATSRFFREVREVYEVQRAITDEQRVLTAFWDCNPYVMHVQGHAMFATKKITPGGHWMGIAGIAARQARASAVETAEAYARTAVALADGFLTSWETKYRTGVVRPETVINTYLDPAWAPLLQTPPFPEYTSGHSVISNAAAAVLTAQFGPNVRFIDSTETPYGLPARTFPSFQAAADEAAISRLYGGIHYRHSIEQGSAQGKRVGAHVVAHVRTRVGEPTVAQR